MPEIESELGRIGGTRVTVFATEESSRVLVSALNVVPATEVCFLPWPPARSFGSAAGSEVTETAKAPDLVVCEIGDMRQALDCRRELGRIWPDTLVVSCEKGSGTFEGRPGSLVSASRDAGYYGHVLIDEAALHLPFFLRYAAQRRQTEMRLERMERVLNAFSHILISLDLQRVAAEVIAECSRWVRADAWLLYEVAEDGRSLELILAEGMRVRPHSLKLAFDGFTPGNAAPPDGETTVINQVEVGRVEVTDDRGPARSHVLCLPLTVEDEVIGVIEAIRHESSGSFEKPDEQILRELSRIASIALNNAMRYERAERRYMQDDLTHLYNSRYLRQFIDREIKRARRYESRFAVVFIDVDGFKGVNDHYGHRVGSQTLCEIAGLLTEAVRETDVVARYGGDEFTIVLTETSAAQALATAERIRHRLAEKVFSGGSEYSFSLTASFGVAVFPEHAQNGADLLEKADLAMYEAKAANKNNVKLSS